MTTESAGALRAGLDRARWTTIDLWRGALGVGGAMSPEDVADFASGARQASQLQHDILAAALNDHFADHGRAHPVPYWRQLVGS